MKAKPPQHGQKKASPGSGPTAGRQLHFAFFTPSETALDPGSTEQPESELEHLMGAARNVLLEASPQDLNAALPLLLEFCEASLTRALDVARRRTGLSFSDEEYRSLRGIGQAHWLLVERQQDRD